MTCPSEQLLIAIALGELLPDDAVAISEHLTTCEQCAAFTREHAELASLLRADSVSAASEMPFVQRVMNECAPSPSRCTGGLGFTDWQPWQPLLVCG
jgi:anti-sigma factor RsiW